MPVRHRLFLVLAGLLWGTGGLTGSLLGRTAGLSPVAVAAYRLTAGGVQSCYFAAVSLTSVSLATLITIGSAPVIVQGASRLLRRPSSARPVTTCLALAGLGLLVGLPSGGFGESAVLASAGLAVAAASGFAALTLLGGVPVDGLDELTTVGFGFLAGGALLMAVAAMAGYSLGFTPRPAAIGLLIALGTGPTAIAYTLYLRGLRTSPAGTAALISLLEPLTGTVLAVLLLGNRLGPVSIAGAVLLALAVILTACGRGG
jgi:DME family drug/metabolite transporter